MSEEFYQNYMKEIDLSAFKNVKSDLCDRCLNVKPMITCPYYGCCPYQSKNKANVVINEYMHEKEIMIFKDSFFYRGDIKVDTNIDRTRNWIYNDLGVLEPTEKNLNGTIFNLYNSLKDSRKRTLQNFHGYVRSNAWSYFLTLTFKDKDKLSEDEVGYLWQLFRQKLQYRFPDIKIICVREHHKKGGLHFHGLLGNCNLDKYLRIAINSAEFYEDRKGDKHPNKYYMQQLKNEFGDQVYNIDSKIYSEGHLTIVKIKEFNYDKISRYLSKYFLKENVSFNKKTYWHTNNLNFYNKHCAYLTNNEQHELLKEINLLNFVNYKETEKFYLFTLKK